MCAFKRTDKENKVPENYDWGRGCQSCVHYRNYLKRGFIFDFTSGKNLCKGVNEINRNDFWVRNRNGGCQKMEKKNYERLRWEVGLEIVKITSCQFKWFGSQEFDDHGKKVLKEYCGNWKPILTVSEAIILRNKKRPPRKDTGYAERYKKREELDKLKTEIESKEEGDKL